jgi:hypothetical protein
VNFKYPFPGWKSGSQPENQEYGGQKVCPDNPGIESVSVHRGQQIERQSQKRDPFDNRELKDVPRPDGIELPAGCVLPRSCIVGSRPGEPSLNSPVGQYNRGIQPGKCGNDNHHGQNGICTVTVPEISSTPASIAITTSANISAPITRAPTRICMPRSSCSVRYSSNCSVVTTIVRAVCVYNACVKRFAK